MLHTACYRKYSLLSLMAPIALLLNLPANASAQALPQNVPITAEKATSSPLISMELKQTRLRQALESLFSNARAQFSLAEDVPDTPVTLSLRDQPLDSALRILLQQGSNTRQRLTYSREAGVYQIKAIPVSAEPLQLEMIRLMLIRPSDVQERLKTAFPEVEFVAAGPSPNLLVRAPADQIAALRQMVALLDEAPHTVVLKAEVVLVSSEGTSTARKASTGFTKGGVSASSRSALLATTLQTTSGQEATSEDRILGSPAQSAKLHWNATPTLLGDGGYELHTSWEVSLSLSAGSMGKAIGNNTGLVRLEKRLSNVSRIRPGETVVVGGVILSQYGLKGEILFFVTLTDVPQAPGKP